MKGGLQIGRQHSSPPSWDRSPWPNRRRHLQRVGNGSRRPTGIHRCAVLTRMALSGRFLRGSGESRARSGRERPIWALCLPGLFRSQEHRNNPWQPYSSYPPRPRHPPQKSPRSSCGRRSLRASSSWAGRWLPPAPLGRTLPGRRPHPKRFAHRRRSSRLNNRSSRWRPSRPEALPSRLRRGKLSKGQCVCRFRSSAPRTLAQAGPSCIHKPCRSKPLRLTWTLARCCF